MGKSEWQVSGQNHQTEENKPGPPVPSRNSKSEGEGRGSLRNPRFLQSFTERELARRARALGSARSLLSGTIAPAGVGSEFSQAVSTQQKMTQTNHMGKQQGVTEPAGATQGLHEGRLAGAERQPA